MNKFILDKIISECINEEILRERWEAHTGVPMTERENEPEHIISKVYKQVRVKDGDMTTVYPLYINSAFGWKIGKWYNAGIGDYKVEIDDETGIPTGKVEVKTTAGQKNMAEQHLLRSNPINEDLSFRPGLHFGSLPYATHIYNRKDNFEDGDIDGTGANNPYYHLRKSKKKSERDKYADLKKNYDYTKTRWQSDDLVWCECDIIFDKDYQEEANKNGITIDKNGKTSFNASKACLLDIPINGAYKYRTNSSASKELTWYISGAFKINRILSDEEVHDICNQNGFKALDRKSIIDFSSIQDID